MGIERQRTGIIWSQHQLETAGNIVHFSQRRVSTKKCALFSSNFAHHSSITCRCLRYCRVRISIDVTDRWETLASGQRPRHKNQSEMTRGCSGCGARYCRIAHRKCRVTSRRASSARKPLVVQLEQALTHMRSPACVMLIVRQSDTLRPEKASRRASAQPIDCVHLCVTFIFWKRDIHHKGQRSIEFQAHYSIFFTERILYSYIQEKIAPFNAAFHNFFFCGERGEIFHHSVLLIEQIKKRDIFWLHVTADSVCCIFIFQGLLHIFFLS